MVGWDRIALTKIQKFLGWNTLFYKLLLVKIVKKLVGSSIQILNSRSESRSSTQIPTLQYIVSHTVYILCSALGPQFLFLSSQGYKSWPSYLTEYNFPGGLFSISDKNALWLSRVVKPISLVCLFLGIGTAPFTYSMQFL